MLACSSFQQGKSSVFISFVIEEFVSRFQFVACLKCVKLMVSDCSLGDNSTENMPMQKVQNFQLNFQLEPCNNKTKLN